MNKELCLQQLWSGTPVPLSELLANREQRARRQQELLSRGGSLISFTMNIAGPVKTAPVLSAAFADGCARIFRQLEWHGIPVTAQEESVSLSGQTLYLLTSAPAETLKALTVEIEDSFPMGRLFDIDVLSSRGILSRAALGYPGRKCLICGKPAVLCARGRTHSCEELQVRTVGLICGYFNEGYADRVAALASRALLYEVAVTPKPGLVDRSNSGAHQDMDIFSFLGSTATLTPYLRDCVLLGIAGSRLSPGELFRTLRYPGRLAEDEMLRTTGGVNTHKGAIFSMGILCAALGCLYDREAPWHAADVFTLCRKMCTGLVEKELAAQFSDVRPTNGEQLYRRYHIPGVRGEAAAGFPSVEQIGLPALKQHLAEGRNLNDAGALTLLHLMAHVEDTNLIHRSDPDTAAQLREEIRDLLARGNIAVHELEALDDQLSRRGLSAGGCADLLALSFLMYLAETELAPLSE